MNFSQIIKVLLFGFQEKKGHVGAEPLIFNDKIGFSQNEIPGLQKWRNSFSNCHPPSTHRKASISL